MLNKQSNFKVGPSGVASVSPTAAAKLLKDNGTLSRAREYMTFSTCAHPQDRMELRAFEGNKAKQSTKDCEQEPQRSKDRTG
jgi:hypothetical protein